MIFDIEEKTKELVMKYCNELKLGKETVEKTIEILNDGNNEKYENAVVGSIYVAAILTGDRRTQEEIREITGTSIAKIRKAYANVAKDLDIDIML